MFKEVSSDLWDDFERLFGDNGACGGCWCQHWRIAKGGKHWDNIKGEIAKGKTKGLFLSGKITGLLAYRDGKAVGWCSYGPRENYARINAMKAYARDDTDCVWSLNCFLLINSIAGLGFPD